VSITIAYDAMHANVGKLPKGAQTAGYVTGSGEVMWTAADWAAHPDAVRIDQSPLDTELDEMADVLDFENGAATLASLVPWAQAALRNYRSGARPGQRSPLVYCDGSSVTPVANALTAGKVTGVGLFIAKWSDTLTQALEEVVTASGPFPVSGIQFASPGPYDIDVFSSSWLAARSARH
jgi:hypothetical protein